MRATVIVIILSVLFVSCGKKDKNSELTKLKSQYEALGKKIKALEKEIGKTPSAASTNEVMIAADEVKLKPFNHYVEVQGKVDGEENVTVTSKTPGVITNILVKEGDIVKKGQKLAELDKSVMLQTLQELKTSQVYFNDLYEKQKRLWDQKIGSEVQYLTAKNTKEGMDNKIKTLEENIDLYNITSPINGTVEEIPVKVGQSIAPGITAFRVVNFSSIKVVSEVAESYSTKIHTGDDVLVTFPDNDEKLSAKITFSSKFINPTNRTFLVEAKLASGSIEYRANMIAILKIVDYAVKEAVVLPLNIIQSDNTGKYVFVVDDKGSYKTAKKRMVTIGRSYNGEVEIVSGLVKGDKVITVGYQNVEDGVKVNI